MTAPIGELEFLTKLQRILNERLFVTSCKYALLLALAGLTQPKVSAMLRGRFRGFSERRLIDCLTSLGRDVQIVIKEAPRRRTEGKLTVVVA